MQHGWETSSDDSGPPARRPRTARDDGGHVAAARDWETSSDDGRPSLCGSSSAGDAASDFDDDEDAPTEAEVASQEFLGLLNYLLGFKISAQDMCLLCYWGHKAGLPDRIGQHGFRPDAPSSHYQRHLDSVGTSKADNERKNYRLSVVGQRRADTERQNIPMVFQPGHELLHYEFEENPLIPELLHEAVEAGMPPSYKDHVVVASHRDEQIVPLGLYMDGVPYSITDSVVAISFINLLTQARHYMCIVRKRLCCRCGCRGWCTWHAVLSFVAWCIRACAAGFFPPERHDGLPWTERDGHRASLAGKRLGFRGAVCQLRGDWAEFCERLGLPTWQSGLRPCFLCAADLFNMYSITGLSLDSTPWHGNVDKDFEDACARCEIHVRVTAANHPQLCRRLKYDKRKDGAMGLALKSNFEELGLLENDRLEPSGRNPDVGAVFDATSFPFDVVFWRKSDNTLCTHRCPLWDASVGMLPTLIIALDMLHTFYLGVLLAFCKHLVWEVLRKPIWARAELTGDERQEVNVLGLRSALFAFYTAHRRLHGPVLTEITEVTTKMFGTTADPKLKTKAAETWGFHLFLMDFLKGRPGVIDKQDIWEQAGEDLSRIAETLETASLVMTKAEIKKCIDSYIHHCVLMRPFEFFTPKHHLMIHLILRAEILGNPRYSATWLDESLNKAVKACVKFCSQLTFDSRAFERLHTHLAELSRRRRF